MRSFERSAPDATWDAVVRLFVDVFSASPYEEPADSLRTLGRWGPERLAGPGGRLVVAGADSGVDGFALSNRLDADSPSWLELIRSVAPEWAPFDHPEDVVAVRELAVAEGARRRGLAERLMRRLLDGRPEGWAVLGVLEEAAAARAAYARWGFEDLGSAPVRAGATRVHVLVRALPWTCAPRAVDLERVARHGGGMVTVDDVRRHCLSLPGVTERTSWGQPAWFARTLMARMWEDGVLTVKTDERDALAAEDPDTYFWTPHHERSPNLVLVRLARVCLQDLDELLTESFRLASATRGRSGA